MLDDARLSKKYCSFALSVAVYLKNRTATRSVVDRTQYEAWHGSGKKPSLKHDRVFRCLTFVHVSKDKRKKLDYRATPRIFVGYSISTKQYFVYNPVAATLHCSRDVVFREGTQYPAPNTANEAILNEHFYRDVIKEPKPKPTPTKKESETLQPTGDENSEHQMEESLDDDLPPDPPNTKRKKSRELTAFQMSLREVWKLLAEGSRRNRAGKLAESAQLAREDEEFEDMILIYAAAAISNGHQDGVNDPTSDKAATESPLADKWDTAIKEELDAIG
jgi:hypothetical protein